MRTKTVFILAVTGMLTVSIYHLRNGRRSAVVHGDSSRITDHRGQKPGKISIYLPGDADADELRWQEWLRGPRSAENIRAIEEWLKELATKDPNRAMLLALAETDPKIMQNFRDAVLRGWASMSCEAAANWVMQLPVSDHHDALAAVFAGASVHSDTAIDLGQRLCAQDPTLAGDVGQLLITALAQSGQYEPALRFAATETSENRPAWMNLGYFQWATREPEQAVSSFEKITDPELRRAALQGIVAGWAPNNPSALANYLMRLESSEDRAEALAQTFNQWVNSDPATASEWLINNCQTSPDMDSSAAKIAVLPSLISRKPEIAVAWAEAIAEPELRAATLQAVAREWIQKDPDAARRFINSNPSLSPEEQKALAKGFEFTSSDAAKGELGNLK